MRSRPYFFLYLFDPSPSPPNSGILFIIARNQNKIFQQYDLNSITLVPNIVDRLSKNREVEEEEENTITFRLKCIVIA